MIGLFKDSEYREKLVLKYNYLNILTHFASNDSLVEFNNFNVKNLRVNVA